MNWVSNIINLFSDIYCVSDMEFAKIHSEPLRRLITGPIPATHPVLMGCRPVSTRTRLGGSKQPMGHNTRNYIYFQAREGWRASTEETPPLSCILSKGGGWRGCVDREPLHPSHVLSEGGGGSSNTMKRPSLHRVGSVL
jgi:hypothetical protein